MNSQNRQIEEIIANIVMPMEDEGVSIISPDAVAIMVDKIIDPDNVTPILKNYAAILQLRQSVRAYLRRRHDPIERAEQNKFSDGLFDNDLQFYYPVTVIEKDTDGKEIKKAVYKQRLLLTQSERVQIAAVMTRQGKSLIDHADALIAEGESLQAVAS